MTNIFVGFFDSSINRAELEREIETNGFTTNDYIVYVNEGAANYLVSTSLHSDTQKEEIEKIYSKHQVGKTFYFTRVSENLSYQDLKSMIEVNAKSQIEDFKPISPKEMSEGIDDQVIS